MLPLDSVKLKTTSNHLLTIYCMLAISYEGFEK